MAQNFKNRLFQPKTNKYNLTDEIKGEIHDKYTSGEWSSWRVMKLFGVPINYVRTVMKRNSWAKYGTNE
jgi:hypothetical protein